MDERLAHRMTNLTTEFYRTVSASFSATRQSPWPGWERLLLATGLHATSELRLLDLACGNLRFERFLEGRVAHLETWAADTCDTLLPEVPAHVHFQHVDLVWNLGALDAPVCDVAVSFGFMHHLPLASQRLALLRTLVNHVRPKGYVAMSFWQFALNERIRAKATPVVGGDKGDYLLGWQGRNDVRRYCHSFDEREIDLLSEAVGDCACEVDRYSADGRDGNLNRYLVLQRM